MSVKAQACCKIGIKNAEEVMNALEQEIIEKFYQLDPAAQQRVRKRLAEEQPASFDYDAWFHEVEALREEIRARHGDQSIDGVGILRDIRAGDDE